MNVEEIDLMTDAHRHTQIKIISRRTTRTHTNNAVYGEGISANQLQVEKVRVRQCVSSEQSERADNNDNAFSSIRPTLGPNMSSLRWI